MSTLTCLRKFSRRMPLLACMGELLRLRDHLADRSRPSARSTSAFFFDLACPFSYLAAERVERVLGEADWVPVASFGMRAVGGEDSARFRREAEQRAVGLRLPLVWPDRLGAGVPSALRAASFAAECGAGARFALAAAGWPSAAASTSRIPRSSPRLPQPPGSRSIRAWRPPAIPPATRFSFSPPLDCAAVARGRCRRFGLARGCSTGQTRWPRPAGDAAAAGRVRHAARAGFLTSGRYLLHMPDHVDRAVRAISLRNSYLLVWAQFGHRPRAGPRGTAAALALRPHQPRDAVGAGPRLAGPGRRSTTWSRSS